MCSVASRAADRRNDTGSGLLTTAHNKVSGATRTKPAAGKRRCVLKEPEPQGAVLCAGRRYPSSSSS